MYNGATETIVGEQTSSVHAKENILPLTGVLGKIRRMQPISFKFKPEYYGGKRSIGFIAEDMVKIVPEVVTMDTAVSINYSLLSTIAIQGIKELEVTVKEQQKEISDLKEELAQQKAEIASLKKKL